MNLFNPLPGFERSAPGLEQRIWRRLPAILPWGKLLPLGCFIVRVMKGPAYVADAYPLPEDAGVSMTRP